MADRNKILRVLKEYRFVAESILLDDFGYNIAEIKSITDETLDTDVVIIGYSISVENEEVIATTHYITLAELVFADTVIISSEKPLEVIN